MYFSLFFFKCKFLTQYLQAIFFKSLSNRYFYAYLLHQSRTDWLTDWLFGINISLNSIVTFPLLFLFLSFLSNVYLYLSVKSYVWSYIQGGGGVSMSSPCLLKFSQYSKQIWNSSSLSSHDRININIYFSLFFLFFFFSYMSLIIFINFEFPGMKMTDKGVNTG